MEDLRVSAEAQIDDSLATEIALARPCFPLRPAKIERPLLPEETLPRDRLFDWLDARANRRIVYVIAEAGFGKTTLVADYLRRSSLRTFWYRLDGDETDGLVFLRYLIASCRSVDPRLLGRSAALLAEASIEPATQEAVLEAVLAEIGGLGEMPSALVLDDFHMVESVPAIGPIVERLIARAPISLKLVVASRRTPSLSVAALRARGELAELGRKDLKFNEAETCELFRDSYHHPLEPDVLHDLHTRTDGWAASLQLVKTAVDGRSPGQVRSFVESMSGAEGDLYDYLAEEVVGELDPELRDFLVRVSILEDIEPETAAVAAEVSPELARRLLVGAQQLGLMSRGDDPGSIWRPHPLVREFLQAHLEAELGDGGVADMHRRLAEIMEPRSWRVAAHHWAAAGDPDSVRRVVSAATPAIIGTGDLAAAQEFIARFPDPNPNLWFDLLRIRGLIAQEQWTDALAEVRRLRIAADGTATADKSLASLFASTMLTVGITMDDIDLRATAARVLAHCDDPELASIARASEEVYRASEAGSLNRLRYRFLDTLRLNRERGHLRYEAISLVNLSSLEIWQHDPEAAETSAIRALSILQSVGNHDEMASAHINLARALAWLGRWDEAQSHIKKAVSGEGEAAEPGILGEAAELEVMLGDPARGQSILDRVFLDSERKRGDPYCRYVAARAALQDGRPSKARELLEQVEGESYTPGFRSARLALGLQVRATVDFADAGLTQAFEQALQFAEQQQAWLSRKNLRLTQALASPADRLTSHLSSLEPEEVALLSAQAELVLRRLADLDDRAWEIVASEASSRPERWRWALRRHLSSSGLQPLETRRAAQLLEMVGTAEDVALLASLRHRRALHVPDAGRALIRRLAPRVYVQDLGRVSVRVGDRSVAGTDIRKKVLSLLCYLLTRPQFTATREQVFEALWPDMDPDSGANSLNQSAYFLRKILEPDCEEDASAGYLRSRADLMWLDHELVTSRSTECLNLIAAIRRDSSPELVTKLAESYTSRFAVDFIYDDWSSPFRDTLHASFLDRIERAVDLDTRVGAFDRALYVAQLALQADPDAEHVELSLLRLYRRMGANAAAAEQYAHYASVMRDQLGVEPPSLESL
jgi:ATP/maltotriose-dependent transcriptional regulator MalT/DNA-binding SARP family transcriptional activator